MDVADWLKASGAGAPRPTRKAFIWRQEHIQIVLVFLMLLSLNAAKGGGLVGLERRELRIDECNRRSKSNIGAPLKSSIMTVPPQR